MNAQAYPGPWSDGPVNGAGVYAVSTTTDAGRHGSDEWGSPPASAERQRGDSPAVAGMQLAELRDQGNLTEEEFQRKKESFWICDRRLV
jgi:hypothetical protein